MAVEIKDLFRMNAEFLQNLMSQQNIMMKSLLEEVQNKKGNGGGAYLDERRFRDMEIFGGKEEQYKEWAMKLKAKIKEYSKGMYDAVVPAEEDQDEIEFDVLSEEEVGYATVLFNRLTMLTSGPAFVMHQAVPKENGLESWRRLAKRYNPMTPMRGL